MPWKKGESGNLKGRPKTLSAAQALARQYTPMAIRRLVEIANGEHGAKANDIRAAANDLINRAWGAPTQPVDLNGKVGVTVKIVEFRESPEGEVESSEDGADGA
jgi:hypothetical protein